LRVYNDVAGVSRHSHAAPLHVDADEFEANRRRSDTFVIHVAVNDVASWPAGGG